MLDDGPASTFACRDLFFLCAAAAARRLHTAPVMPCLMPMRTSPVLLSLEDPLSRVLGGEGTLMDG